MFCFTSDYEEVRACSNFDQQFTSLAAVTKQFCLFGLQLDSSLEAVLLSEHDKKLETVEIVGYEYHIVSLAHC